MGRFRIPLIRPAVGSEELEAVKRVFESGMLTQGEETLKFEKEFAEFLGMKYGIATTSCTTALHLALVCLGVKSGDEVITSDFTFPATANVVFHCGAEPVLCDIRLREFQIDPDLIEPLITKKTKVIVPVHQLGLTADMKPIMELAEKYGLYIMEDAAPALGSKRYGKFAGTFGDMGCFSFHPRKLLGIGEGGMIVTNNEELANLAQSLKNHGRCVNDKWAFDKAGYNYRMSDVQAAIGRVQLRKIPQIIENRRKLAAIYNDAFETDEEVYIPLVPSDSFHTYQSYILLVKRMKNIMKYMRDRGIEVQVATSALSLLPHFFNVKKSLCPNSQFAWEHTLTLPLFEAITCDETSEVIFTLKEVLG